MWCAIKACGSMKCQQLDQLKSFKRHKQKAIFICKCEDIIISTIGQVLKGFLSDKFRLRNVKTICKKLARVKGDVRKLANSRTSIKQKRKILIRAAVQKLLYPILCKYLIPFLEKYNNMS